MFKIKNLLLLFFVFIALVANSQNKKYARKLVDTLASPTLKGRGYVLNGDRLAADFIQAEMQQIGLIPLFNNNQFFQSFTHSVNIFENEPLLIIGSKKLKPGADFILKPFSENMKGNFSVIIYKNEDFDKINERLSHEKSFKNKAVVLWPSDADALKKANSAIASCLKNVDVVVLVNPLKLTWSVSDYRIENKVVFEVSASSMPEINNKTKITMYCQSKFEEKYESYNVAGYIRGAIQDTFLLVTAHYDHLGMMGSALFAGAGDNASGTAMMLDLASDFKQKQPKYSIAFVGFAGEEAGLKGSKYFVENAPVPLQNIRFVMNIDLMGGGSIGSTVVNGTVHPDEFNRLVEINDSNKLLGRVKARGKAANSDHYWFTEKGVPAFFMYAEGDVTAYHDIEDTRENLPLSKYNELYRLVKLFLDGF